jgi:hypothetical protein
MSKNRRKKPRTIPKDVENFVKTTWKRFKKDTKGCYKNKKKQVLAYYQTMAEGMQYCIEFFVRYGHLKDENIAEAFEFFKTFLRTEDFCKELLVMLKDEELPVKEYIYLPIIIRGVLEEESRKAKQILAENADAEVPSHENLVKLSMWILKKKIKKLEKDGVPRELAFDVLSVIPSKEAIEFSRNYRIRTFFNILYEYAKTTDVAFEKLFKRIFGREYVPTLIVCALLEKKERFADLTEKQKAFHTALTSWCIDTMENDLEYDEIMSILKRYVATRQQDDLANRDGNRRYPLSTLSEVDYPRLYKAIKSFISRNEADKKYL